MVLLEINYTIVYHLSSFSFPFHFHCLLVSTVEWYAQYWKNSKYTTLECIWAITIASKGSSTRTYDRINPEAVCLVFRKSSMATFFILLLKRSSGAHIVILGPYAKFPNPITIMIIMIRVWKEVDELLLNFHLYRPKDASPKRLPRHHIHNILPVH